MVAAADCYLEFMRLYKEGAWEELRAMLHPEVSSDNMAPENTPISGNRRGVDEFMDYLMTSAEPTAEYEFLDSHTILESGNTVVALGRERYRIKATGKTAETPFVHESRWRNGKLHFWREYYDTAAMRDAYDPMI